MAIVEIKVPDIGDFAEVTVIELMVKPGDTVNVVKKSDAEELAFDSSSPAPQEEQEVGV